MTDMKKERLLLHSCCGPCSTAVIERLAEDWELTVFFFNPNISGEEEYALRRDEQKRFITEYNASAKKSVLYMEGDYRPELFFSAALGHEQDPEGGERCARCFLLRLSETARLANELAFDAFDTTLSVSPHKNYDIISAVGKECSDKYGVRYLAGNYKKKDGFKRSIELAEEYGLYRQNFCGCIYSKRGVQPR